MPRYISFENFLRELETIDIDHLDYILQDQNGVNIASSNIGNSYNQILTLKDLKYWMNLITRNRQNEIFKIIVGDEYYSFFGKKFLRNVSHVGIGQLENLTKSNNLNIAQIIYLIINIERVIFNN